MASAAGEGSPTGCTFPDEFLWETATASHQIEGANNTTTNTAPALSPAAASTAAASTAAAARDADR